MPSRDEIQECFEHYLAVAYFGRAAYSVALDARKESTPRPLTVGHARPIRAFDSAAKREAKGTRRVAFTVEQVRAAGVTK